MCEKDVNNGAVELCNDDSVCVCLLLVGFKLKEKQSMLAIVSI